MNRLLLALDVNWGRPTWYSGFRYQKGVVVRQDRNPPLVERIHRHIRSGRLLVWSANELDGAAIMVNAGPVRILRHGLGNLYGSL